MAEFDKFCPNCGQKPTDGKVSLHDLFHEFVHTLFHLDGKFFTTLRHIFVPGKLTVEFFKGHHKRYAHPVQLFLVLGAIMFGFVTSALSKAEKQIEKENKRRALNIEKRQMIRDLDSMSRVLAPQYGGRATQSAYDSLVLATFKKHFPIEYAEHYESKKMAKMIADSV
jgi:hypothetical protein